MTDEDQLLQASVNKLFEEIYNYPVIDKDEVAKVKLKAALFETLHEYDNEFYKMYDKIPLSEISNQMISQQNVRELPDESVLQSNFMKNTFVSDAGYLTRYQRLNRVTQYNHAEAAPPPVPSPPQRNYESEFINTRFQFSDPNLNQKAYLAKQNGENIKQERDLYLQNLDSNKCQQDFLTLMKQPQIVGEAGQPVIAHYKKEIEKLGGIQDTVGVMERSLNELQHPTQKARQYGDKTTNTYRQVNQKNGSDTFLKEYAANVNPNTTSLVQKSKQMREEMMKKIILSNN